LCREYLTVAVLLRDMLQAMQQSAAPAPSPTSPSFAGLLAALATPAKQAGVPGDRSSSQGWETGVPGDRSSPPGWRREPVWSDDGLADDYATLSYERALRAHARYRSQDASLTASDRALTESADSGPIRNREAFPATGLPAGLTGTPRTASSAQDDVQPQTAFGPPAALNLDLKSASITIRLSKPECAQLRKRAAEAGLTVSAYLRSCTFEAESLRALVKETLTQLRSDSSKANGAKGGQAAANQDASKPIRRSWRHWWARFWPRAHASQRIARA
jgi:predicted DNA binding CopG/RHH family protein